MRTSSAALGPDMWRATVAACALVLVWLVVPAVAQTKSTADDVLEEALGHWRAASWYSKLGDPNITAIETESLRNSWQGVAGLPPDGRPSLYVKDARWSETVAEIGKLSEQAADAADRNDSTATDAALARIGDALAEARKRAGIQGFSDAVRRYRDAVDRLSGLVKFAEQRRGAPFDDAQRTQVKQTAAECADALAAAQRMIPPRWQGDDKLRALLKQNADSVEAVSTGAEHGASGLEIAAQINVVRSNYYLLFLNYG